MSASVVPGKGDVDRNPYVSSVGRVAPVVPRKGDVDRNGHLAGLGVYGVRVVPRKGDVDRNRQISTLPGYIQWSSPARGTWIEIGRCTWSTIGIHVVPRKGDVDRNEQQVAAFNSSD